MVPMVFDVSQGPVGQLFAFCLPTTRCPDVVCIYWGAGRAMQSSHLPNGALMNRHCERNTSAIKPLVQHDR